MQGTPHVTEQLIDSKKAVDKQLKVVCEEFISHTTTMLIQSLQEFLEKVSNLKFFKFSLYIYYNFEIVLTKLYD